MSLVREPVMHRSMLKSKIHRATVTQANLNYEGSLTVDARCWRRPTFCRLRRSTSGT